MDDDEPCISVVELRPPASDIQNSISLIPHPATSQRSSSEFIMTSPATFSLHFTTPTTSHLRTYTHPSSPSSSNPFGPPGSIEPLPQLQNAHHRTILHNDAPLSYPSPTIQTAILPPTNPNGPPIILTLAATTLSASPPFNPPLAAPQYSAITSHPLTGFIGYVPATNTIEAITHPDRSEFAPTKHFTVTDSLSPITLLKIR